MNRKDIRTSLLDNLDFWGSDAGGITVQGDLDWLTDQVAELIATELDALRAKYDQRSLDAAATSLSTAGLSGFMATGRSGAYGAVAKELQDRVTELRTGA